MPAFLAAAVVALLRQCGGIDARGAGKVCLWNQGALCFLVVEHYGGQVWVESEMGVGSTFSFLLPISQGYNDPWMEVDVPPLDLSSDQPDES